MEGKAGSVFLTAINNNIIKMMTQCFDKVFKIFYTWAYEQFLIWASYWHKRVLLRHKSAILCLLGPINVMFMHFLGKPNTVKYFEPIPRIWVWLQTNKDNIVSIMKLGLKQEIMLQWKSLDNDEIALSSLVFVFLSCSIALLQWHISIT